MGKVWLISKEVKGQVQATENNTVSGESAGLFVDCRFHLLHIYIKF